MALLSFLLKFRKEWECELVVCSVDHQLRGKEGHEDLEFVSAFCHRHDLSFFGRAVDVASLAASSSLSIEAAARELRYAVFGEVLESCHADILALAHHGDDQIETMLMYEVRGSAGLARAGIPVTRRFGNGKIIRPFLIFTKQELAAYCDQCGIAAREDATNASDMHTRNRFRKYVLPFLKHENPTVHLKFQYESERIAEDEAFLLDLAKREWSKVLTSTKPGEVTLSISRLLSEPPPLQRRLIHLILNYLYDCQKIKPLHQSIHIESVLQLVQSDRASVTLDLPGHLQAAKSYGQCRIGNISVAIPGYNQLVNVPGETVIPVGCLVAELVSAQRPATDRDDQLLIDCLQFTAPLRIRSRRLGDRLKTAGLTGSQKVKAIFINEKIDRSRRDSWPLVVDAEGTVLWLPLLRRARLSEPQQAPQALGRHQLLLTFIPLPFLGGQEHEARYSGNINYGRSHSKQS